MKLGNASTAAASQLFLEIANSVFKRCPVVEDSIAVMICPDPVFRPQNVAVSAEEESVVSLQKPKEFTNCFKLFKYKGNEQFFHKFYKIATVLLSRKEE